MASWNQARVLMGALLLNIPLCSTKIFGNIITYIYSLFYSCDDPHLNGMKPPWMYSIFTISLALSTTPSKMMMNAIGLRMTCFLGVICYALAFFLTYFSVQHSAWATAMTLMVLGGVGDALVLCVSLVYLAAWFKEKTVLVTSLLQASNGLAGIIINEVITIYVNPDNLSPDINYGHMSYFSQTKLLARIPMMFVVVGSILFAIMLPGFCLLKKPPADSESCHHLIEKSTRKNVDLSQNTQSRYYMVENEIHRTQFTSQNEFPSSTMETEETTGNGDVNEINENKSPSQVLKTETFYLIWGYGFVQAFGLGVITIYFKLFGQIWISDDQFLASVGSFLSPLTFISQLLCGYFIDKFGLKNTIIGHLAIESAFMATYYFTAGPSKWLYFVWTNVMMSLYYDQFLLLCLSSLKLFGEEFYTTNFGLLLSGLILANFGGPPVMIFILDTFGWFFLFFMVGVVTFIVLVLIIWRLNCQE